MNLSPVVALLACTEIQLHTYKAENLLNSLEQVTNDRLDLVVQSLYTKADNLQSERIAVTLCEKLYKI